MKTILLLISIVVFALNQVNSQSNDLTINVSDKMINKLLTAIGPVSGEEEYVVMMVKGVCKWTVENPVIKLDLNKAWFEADVKVSSGNFTYSDRINGLIRVIYNQAKDRLELSLENVFVNLKVKVLGKERLIKTLDLANYYKTPFYFDGPGSYAENFEFEMPDGSLKKLKASVKSCDIAVLKGIIQMKANLDFIDAAKVKVIPKTSPATPPATTPAPQTNDKKEKKKKEKKKKK